jgi:heme a synthase
VWVLVQGAFGKFTVTLKLLPAVVTLHLLGGLLLLLLLVLQWSRLRPEPALSVGVARAAVLAALALLGVQVALGGWVSSNYAVLACQGFPLCNGAWWPEGMDWRHGFTLWRDLGRDAQGQWLPAMALVAIHMAHRLMAVLVLAVLAGLAWRLAQGPQPRLGHALAALLVFQFFSGLSNVVLGWPLLAALLHTAGAAALVALLGHVAVQAGQASAQPARAARATWNTRLS